jgi:hypothetical protein
MVPKKPALGLDPRVGTVSRLREARFGGRRKVGLDHALTKAFLLIAAQVTKLGGATHRAFREGRPFSLRA